MRYGRRAYSQRGPSRFSPQNQSPGTSDKTRYERGLSAGCAVDTDKIALTARIIRNSGIEFEFRTTVTEELHEESDFDAIGKWLGGKGKYFLQAVTDNGELLSGKSFHAPSSEKLGKYAGLLRNYGFDASVRKA